MIYLRERIRTWTGTGDLLILELHDHVRDVGTSLTNLKVNKQ